MTTEPCPDRESFQERVKQFSSLTDGRVFFAIVDNITNRALGWLDFHIVDTANKTIEVGYVLYGVTLQRTRGGTEAQSLLASYVFDVLGYRRYEWRCNKLNELSKRAAERFGFTFEGVLRQELIVKGRNRVSAWFSMLDSEWPYRKAALEAWLDPKNFDSLGCQIKPLSFFQICIRP